MQTLAVIYTAEQKNTTYTAFILHLALLVLTKEKLRHETLEGLRDMLHMQIHIAQSQLIKSVSMSSTTNLRCSGEQGLIMRVYEEH